MRKRKRGLKEEEEGARRDEEEGGTSIHLKKCIPSSKK